jgi:periplasmic protein TonB
MKRLAIALLVAPLTAACLTGRAQTPARQPALDVPPPPPRVIEPVPAEPVTTIEPVADLPPVPSPSRPRPQPPRDPGKEAKPEPKPEAPPAPEAAPPTNPPPPNPALQIRTPGDTSEAARQVRDILDRASKTLNSIDYGPLNQQRKESYDTAKRFILQAEDAIKAANFVYAKFLADKADTLAKELQGR